MKILKSLYTVITSTLAVAFILKIIDTKGVFKTYELIIISYFFLLFFALAIESITMGHKYNKIK